MNSDKIPHYIALGHNERFWYEETQTLFQSLFGRADLPLVAQIFAATSINSSLLSNVRLFRKAYHEISNSLPLSGYLPVMKLQLERISKGESIQGRKITSYAAALSGDPNAVTVDIWHLRAFDEDRKYNRLRNGETLLRSSGATNRQYTEIESYVRSEARKIDVTPRQFSAMLWAGVRYAFTKQKLTRYDDVLKNQMFNMFDKPILQ